MSTVTVPTTVREFAQALKVEFQTHGIYRGLGAPKRDESGALTGPTCFLINRVGDEVWDLGFRFEDALRAVVSPDGLTSIVTWLDSHSDDEVYALLDTIG